MQTTTLSRRTSITIPTKLTINGSADQKKSSHPLDLYTSLKDLLPSAAVNSPKPSSPEIPIRNRLVKQAAWAYLQPAVSPSPDYSSTRYFLRRLWNPVASCFRFVRTSVFLPISRAFDHMLKAIGFGSLMNR